MKRNRRSRRIHRIRQLFFVLVLSLLIVAGGLRVNALASSARTNARRTYTSIMIASGDNLWSIAQKYCGSSDYDQIRRYIQELRTMNHLDADESLTPGAYLMVSIPE